MTLATTMMAAASWPDAAIAIAGVVLVGAVVVVVISQALTTWRARMTASADRGSWDLAEQNARDLRALRARVEELEGAAGRAPR
jgi:hypothetical protein